VAVAVGHRRRPVVRQRRDLLLPGNSTAALRRPLFRVALHGHLLRPVRLQLVPVADDGETPAETFLGGRQRGSATLAARRAASPSRRRRRRSAALASAQFGTGSARGPQPPPPLPPVKETAALVPASGAKGRDRP